MTQWLLKLNVEKKKADDATAQIGAQCKQAMMANANVGNAERRISAKCARIALLKKEIDLLKSSVAYRVGMVVTWPARKAWGGVKCLRENGVKYTVKHAVGKVLRRFGSKGRW